MTVKHQMNRFGPALALALFLAACAAPVGAPSGETPMPSSRRPPVQTLPSDASQPPQESPVVSGEVPTDLIEEARADAAERAGAAPDEVEVLSAEAVTWNDGSLGCPQPGVMYTQALVDGYRVVVVADGTEYHYHAAETGTVTYCPNPQPGGSTRS